MLHVWQAHTYLHLFYVNPLQKNMNINIPNLTGRVRVEVNYTCNVKFLTYLSPRIFYYKDGNETDIFSVLPFSIRKLNGKL